MLSGLVQSRLEEKRRRYADDFRQVLDSDPVGAYHRKLKGDLAESRWNYFRRGLPRPFRGGVGRKKWGNVRAIRRDDHSARAQIERLGRTAWDRNGRITTAVCCLLPRRRGDATRLSHRRHPLGTGESRSRYWPFRLSCSPGSAAGRTPVVAGGGGIPGWRNGADDRCSAIPRHTEINRILAREDLRADLGVELVP